MKRNEALRSLSRDHHRALVVAQALKRGTDAPAESAGLFLEFWEGHGRAHFRVEEDVLLPIWAEAAPVEETLVSRMLLDHVWIRAAARRLRAGPASAQEIGELGTRLESHVRLEERQIFPAIESALDPDQLSALAEAVAAAENR